MKNTKDRGFISVLATSYLNSWPHLYDLLRPSHSGMLSRAEAEFLRGSKQAKPQQLRYLRHCVKRKITVFRENDLPAIMANDWARPLFQAAIGNNSGSVTDFNSASGPAPRTEIYPSRTNDLRARGQVRIKASASGADKRGFESRRARPIHCS